MNQFPDSQPARDLPIPPRYWWLKRIAIAVGLLIVGLVGLRLWWGHIVDRRIDEMVAKYHAAGDPILPEDFVTESLPDDQNAVWYFEQAGTSITYPNGVDIDIHDIDFNGELHYTNAADVAAIIEANTRVIELAHTARKMRKADWKFDATQPLLTINQTPRAPFRSLVYFLRVAATHDALKGKPLDAIARISDVLVLSDVFREESTLVSQIVADAQAMAACDTIRKIAPLLARAKPNEDVKRLIAALLDIQSSKQGWNRAMLFEQAQLLDTLTRLADARLTATNFAGVTVGGTTSPLMTIYVVALGPMLKTSGFDMIAHTHKAQEAGTMASYQQATKHFDEWSAFDQMSGFPTDQLTIGIRGKLVGSYSRVILLHFRHRAIRFATATVLAINLFESDHGRRPETLDELVPDYLPSVPLDPFAPGDQPIRYLPHAEDPRLYSVGENGIDDDGAFDESDLSGRGGKSPDIPFFLDRDTLTELLDEWSGQHTEQEDEDRGDTQEDQKE